MKNISRPCQQLVFSRPVRDRESLSSRRDNKLVCLGTNTNTNYQPDILYLYHTRKVRALGGGEDYSALDRLFVFFMFHVFRFMARKSDMKMSFAETKQLKCTIVLFCPSS